MKNRIIICNWITNHLSSLVKLTGLLVSIGVLTILCSCGDDDVIYDSRMESGDTTALLTDQQNESVDDPSKNAEDESAESEEELRLQPVNDTLPVSDPVATDYAMVIHVCGAVNNPGVYELKAGSRVIDAVNSAGGFSDGASADALNLALPVYDGYKVYVPTEQELQENDISVSDDNLQYIEENSTTNDTSDVNDAGGMININTATRDELMTLNGIGATRADAIITYRENNGHFSSVEEIMNVNGIKEGSYEKIKDSISVK